MEAVVDSKLVLEEATVKHRSISWMKPVRSNHLWLRSSTQWINRRANIANVTSVIFGHVVRIIVVSPWWRVGRHPDHSPLKLLLTRQRNKGDKKYKCKFHFY